MLAPVKTRNTEAIERPIIAQNAQKVICAVDEDMVWVLNVKKNMNASGASITTHLSGLPKNGT